MKKVILLLTLILFTLNTSYANNTSIGMNPEGISYWSTQYPFIDFMKQASNWQTGCEWGNTNCDNLENGNSWDTKESDKLILDENGWIKGFENDIVFDYARTIIFHGNQKEMIPYDEYIIYYEGNGDLKISGADILQEKDGEKHIKLNNNYLWLEIKDIDQNNHLRNIKIIPKKFKKNFEKNEIFNPDWLDIIKDFSTLRFMVWMRTNNDIDQSTWNKRPQINDRIWSTKGVPLEIMIKLSNKLNSNPWFTIHHTSGDDYIQNFAETIKNNLNENLISYIEYSNETWNWMFDQAHYGLKKGKERWGEDKADAFMQYHGMRINQICNIFKNQVFNDNSRINCVASTQTAWEGMELKILECPYYVEEGNEVCYENIDSYAITTYFNGSLQKEENKNIIKDWLDGKDGINEDFPQNAFTKAFEQIKEEKYFTGSGIPSLTQKIKYHKEKADKYGLNLIAYEGGQHISGLGSYAQEDKQVTEFFKQINTNPGIYDLYELMLNAWSDNGGGLLAHFTDIGKQSKYGSWGALTHLNQDLKVGYKYNALIDFIEKLESQKSKLIKLDKSMIFDENISHYHDNFITKAYSLVDNQDQVPNNPQEKLKKIFTGDNWQAIRNKDYLPKSAIIDLKGDYTITHIGFFDSNGNPELKVYSGKAFEWDFVFSQKLDKYNKWRIIEVDNINTRYLRLVVDNADSGIKQIGIYGYLNKEIDLKDKEPVEKNPDFGINIGESIGLNAFIDDPIDLLKNFGHIREYHSMTWDGSSKNEKMFNPSGNNIWNFDAYYQNLSELGIEVIPAIQGNANWILGDGKEYSNHNNKPIKEGKDPLDPASYIEHAKHMFQFVARYGSNKVDEDKLLLADNQEKKSGLGYIKYFENFNEPNKNWAGRDAYFSPYEFATMLSADYDGHEGKLGDNVGIKNADPNSKLVMGGLVGYSSMTNYLNLMKIWFEANRDDKKFVPDVINFHSYNTDKAPEKNDYFERLREIVLWRNTNYPDKQVWLTEFGWDTNPKSEYTAINEQNQANWIVRGYLIGLSTGLDKISMYMLRDVNPENTTKHSSSGLTGPKGDWTPKQSYYSVISLKKILGDMYFDKIISEDEDLYIFSFKSKENDKKTFAIWDPNIENGQTRNYDLQINDYNKALFEKLGTDSINYFQEIININDNNINLEIGTSPVFVSVGEKIENFSFQENTIKWTNGDGTKIGDKGILKVNIEGIDYNYNIEIMKDGNLWLQELVKHTGIGKRCFSGGAKCNNWGENSYIIQSKSTCTNKNCPDDFYGLYTWKTAFGENNNGICSLLGKNWTLPKNKDFENIDNKINNLGLAGFRNDLGFLNQNGTRLHLWTADENGEERAISKRFDFGDEKFDNFDYENKNNGLGAICVNKNHNTVPVDPRKKVDSSKYFLNLPKDNDGWTILEASENSRIVYLSNDGNDEKCKSYSKNEIGENIYLPQNIISCNSFEKAYSLIRNNSNDFLLIKKGSVFYEGFGNLNKFGESKSNPFVITSYGTGKKMPLFKTGKEQGFSITGEFRNLVISGIEFYAHTRNPDSEEFTGINGSRGLRIVGEGKGILLEGNKFSYYTSNVISGYGNNDTTIWGLDFRRNTILNNYSDGNGHSQGLYLSSLSANLEENIFDHNGWYSQDGSGGHGKATMFNHNVYASGIFDSVFSGNIFSRGASIGTKFTSNTGDGSVGSWNILLKNNLYIGGEIGISMGGNTRSDWLTSEFRWQDINIENNIFTNIGWPRPTNRNLGWAIGISDWDGGKVKNNLIINQEENQINNVYGISSSGISKNVSINGNIIHNLKNGIGLQIEYLDHNYEGINGKLGEIENMIFSGNILSFDGEDDFIRAIDYEHIDKWNFKNNIYYNKSDYNSFYLKIGSRINFDNWKNEYENNANNEKYYFYDESRSLGSYLDFINKSGSIDELIKNIRKVDKNNWDQTFIAKNINNYLYKGYFPICLGDNEHSENGKCVGKTQKENIYGGFKKRTWHNGNWSDWEITCDKNYLLKNNKCVGKTQKENVDGGFKKRTWHNGNWSDWEITCDENYLLKNNKCVGKTQKENICGGFKKRTWHNGNWSDWEITCNSGYTKFGNSCKKRISGGGGGTRWTVPKENQKDKKLEENNQNKDKKEENKEKEDKDKKNDKQENKKVKEDKKDKKLEKNNKNEAINKILEKIIDEKKGKNINKRIKIENKELKEKLYLFNKIINFNKFDKILSGNKYYQEMLIYYQYMILGIDYFLETRNPIYKEIIFENYKKFDYIYNIFNENYEKINKLINKNKKNENNIENIINYYIKNGVVEEDIFDKLDNIITKKELAKLIKSINDNTSIINLNANKGCYITDIGNLDGIYDSSIRWTCGVGILGTENNKFNPYSPIQINKFYSNLSKFHNINYEFNNKSLLNYKTILIDLYENENINLK